MTQPGQTQTRPYDPKAGTATASEVNEFHRYSDKDDSPQAQHHTLGTEDNQASPGGHNHDGRNSKLIAGSLPGASVQNTGANKLSADLGPTYPKGSSYGYGLSTNGFPASGPYTTVNYDDTHFMQTLTGHADNSFWGRSGTATSWNAWKAL